MIGSSVPPFWVFSAAEELPLYDTSLLHYVNVIARLLMAVFCSQAWLMMAGRQMVDVCGRGVRTAQQAMTVRTSFCPHRDAGMDLHVMTLCIAATEVTNTDTHQKTTPN